MANCCVTDIDIWGRESAKMEALFKEFKKAEAIDCGTSVFWEGKLLIHCGMKYTPNGDIPNAPRCRGEIVYCDREGNDHIVICQEDAWRPNLGPVMMMLAKFYPEADLSYHAEELEDDILCTNDPDYEDKYLLEVYDPDCVPAPLSEVDERAVLSSEELRQLLLGVFENERRETMLSDLLIKLEDEYGEYTGVHEYEVVSETEFSWE